MILGALAFRNQLEVTEHPQVNEFAQRLLPWLNEIGCGDEIDSFQLEQLSTPLGQLSDSQMTDVRWAGEKATFFCWMLQLRGAMDEKSPADQSVLPKLLRILRPEAKEILKSAKLRDNEEIVENCRHIMLVRRLLQEIRVEESARKVLRHLTTQKLKEIGLEPSKEAFERASETIARMTPKERHDVAGFYFIRDIAAI